MSKKTRFKGLDEAFKDKIRRLRKQIKHARKSGNIEHKKRLIAELKSVIKVLKSDGPVSRNQHRRGDHHLDGRTAPNYHR
jgi:hypothetical protein